MTRPHPRIRVLKSRQRGFTLIELLVVIAVIGVLVALLLPAIQYAREAARRMHCGNNLAQLILGVNHYETVHGVYPTGTVDAKGPILNARFGYHHNWLVQSLPFLEQNALWDAVDRKQSIYHAKNSTILNYSFPLVRCPSHPFLNGPASHYAACHHDAESPINTDHNGVFFLNSRVRYEDVLDGTSNTLYLGEKLADSWDFEWCSGTRGTLRNTGSPINLLTFTKGLVMKSSSNPFTNGTATPGLSPPMQADPLAVPGLESDAKPEETSATIPGAAPTPGKGKSAAPAVSIGNPLYVGGFSSTHPTGAQFAFGDGSVRFLNEMLAGPVLQQLGNRADGKLPVEY